MGLLDEFDTHETVPDAETGGSSTAVSSYGGDPADIDAPRVPVSTPLRSSMRSSSFNFTSPSGVTSPSIFSSSSNPLKRSAFPSLEDPERTRKKLKEHAEEVSDSAELSPEDRKELIDVSQMTMHEAMISLYARVIVITNRFNAQQEERFVLLITGKDFKSKLQLHINACLLAPDITGYLSGPTEAIMALIQQDPSLFGVPKELLEYSDLLARLRKQVVDNLATARGSIRLKIAASLEVKDGNQVPMNDLAKLLSSGIIGIELLPKHWARFAYLRYQMIKFNEHLQHWQKMDMKEESSAVTDLSLSDSASAETNASSTTPKAVKDRYQPSRYWNWIDDHLTDLRTEALAKGKTHHGQQTVLGSYFQKALMQDLKLYTGPDKKPPKTPPENKPLLHWQQKVTAAMVF
ncbi:hypothetical protein V5O48_012108 [Marasmius crinis-equi]|uniref:Uncharacterized protein n=1 Tax=Marasmius crinis-equi TaxID=585013 RepID=A0ABR3F430_9AGAR